MSTKQDRFNRRSSLGEYRMRAAVVPGSGRAQSWSGRLVRPNLDSTTDVIRFPRPARRGIMGVRQEGAEFIVHLCLGIAALGAIVNCAVNMIQFARRAEQLVHSPGSSWNVAGWELGDKATRPAESGDYDDLL